MAVAPNLPLVLLTHPQHRLDDYYGEEALAGLRAVAVSVNFHYIGINGLLCGNSPAKYNAIRSKIPPV